jgi:hypothetical protein
MAEDTLSAVRRVRKEVVDCMRQLMKLAKDRKREGEPEAGFIFLSQGSKCDPRG